VDDSDISDELSPGGELGLTDDEEGRVDVSFDVPFDGGAEVVLLELAGGDVFTTPVVELL
jgi:hypothetical protein